MARRLRVSAGMVTDSRQSFGKVGEDLACDELARRGYAILERRYRTRYGEIDIVARAGRTLVFVEVKARTGEEYGGGGAAVTPSKQQRVVRMAIGFLSRRRLQYQPCRFDVVTVDFEGGSRGLRCTPCVYSVNRGPYRAGSLVLLGSDSLWYDAVSFAGGNNSVVECDLAKVEVAGSNPVSRSTFFLLAVTSRVGSSRETI